MKPKDTGSRKNLDVHLSCVVILMKSNLEGHILVGRYNAEENELVSEMTKNMVQPINILSTLKDRRKDNATIINQV